MEAYPDELRTPPVTLVAVVGMPELHPQISKFLHTEQPPINTLALPDFSKLPAIGGKERRPLDVALPPPKGIVKADWMHKHRTKVPAVLIVLFEREKVNGNSSQWMEVCTNLDSVKNVIRGRNTKLVIAVAQPGLYGETNDERLTSLRKRAEIDAKSFLTFISQDPTELKRSLARLGSVLFELSSLYYKEEGRRVKARIDKKTYGSPDLAVRYNFKMAYYAEFRRDWPVALRCYETAYSLLQEVVSPPADNEPVQRIVEVKAVAEVLHVKVSTLLLHSGREADAVKWFKQHIARYKRLVGPPEGVFLHWAWLSQQYYVFGELLEGSLSAAAASATALVVSGVPERELQPGFYYQIAAGYMRQRRESFQMAFTAFETFEDTEASDVLDGPPEAVGPALYVGQSGRILTRDSQSPSSDEYMRHAMLIEKQFPHVLAAVSLLTKAHERYKLIQANRMIYLLGFDMGREYFDAGEYEKARALFDSVAGIYRKEGWVLLLGRILGFLRESARQLGLAREYIEYSLEMAALPVFEGGEEEERREKAFSPSAPFSFQQRLDVHNEALGIMQGVQAVAVRDGEARILAAEAVPIALEIDLVSPFRSVLSICVTFHEQSVKPGKPVFLTISLLTHLPSTLVLADLEFQFNQSACNFSLCDIEPANRSLELMPCKWKRLVANVTPVKSGKLECLSAIAHIGPYASIRCQVESPALRDPDPLWVFEPNQEGHPVEDIHLALIGQRVIQVEEPEALVDIALEVAAPALLGEAFPVTVHIQSTGHHIEYGELQISVSSAASLVDTPEPLTPTTPAAVVSVGKVFAAAKVGDSSEVSLWELKHPIKLPPLGKKDRWSTTVLLKWDNAAPLNLLVSLGYKTRDSTARQDEGFHQLWLNKNLILNCEEALGISCKYMAPYRRDSLLSSSLDTAEADTTVLPMNETSLMVVNAKNICSVPVLIFPLQVEQKNPDAFQVKRPPAATSEPIRLSPGEVLNELWWITPGAASNSQDTGLLAIKWQRESTSSSRLNADVVQQVSSIDELLVLTSATSSPKPPTTPAGNYHETTTTRVSLPKVAVERAPLVITLQSPAYAMLGVPMVVSYLVENRTDLLQEVNFSVVDAHSFLISGASRGSLLLQPSATGKLALKLVPIVCGMVQLPQVMLTSLQFSASYTPPVSSSQMFVFPTEPRLQPEQVKVYQADRATAFF